MIGQGIYGKIYVENNIAIKKISTDDMFSAAVEWILTRHCKHECVIEYINILHSNSFFELSMPLYKCNLSEYIYMGAPNAVTNNAIIANIARGLEYIHARGVIHGDINPKNILLDDEYRAVIADFGMSSVAMSSHSTNIQANLYRAPEVNRTYARVALTNSIDMWAYGCVVFEMYTKVQFMQIKDEDPTVAISKRYGINYQHRTAREEAIALLTRDNICMYMKKYIIDITHCKLCAGCLVAVIWRITAREACDILSINKSQAQGRKYAQNLIAVNNYELISVDRHIASNIYANNDISIDIAWIIAAMICDRVIEAYAIMDKNIINQNIIDAIVQLRDDPI